MTWLDQRPATASCFNAWTWWPRGEAAAQPAAPEKTLDDDWHGESCIVCQNEGEVVCAVAGSPSRQDWYYWQYIDRGLPPSLPPGHSNTRSANCPPGQPPRPKISFLQKSIASSSCVLSCFRIRCWRRGQAGYRGRRGRSEHTEHWEREIIHWINLNKVLLNYMPNVHSALPQQGGIYNWPGLHLLIEKIEVVLKSSSSGCQNGYTYFCPSNFNYCL